MNYTYITPSIYIIKSRHTDSIQTVIKYRLPHPAIKLSNINHLLTYIVSLTIRYLNLLRLYDFRLVGPVLTHNL
jgi:hypothetical protein